MKSSIIATLLLPVLLAATEAKLVSSTRRTRKLQQNLRRNKQQESKIDDDSSNRGHNTSIRAMQQNGLMKMTLVTDRYPSETSWKIIDNCNDNKVVMSGSNYQTPFKAFVEYKSLPSSQYTIQIQDAFGDGICCGQGDGSFKVTFNDEVVASGGQFRKSETQTWGSCNVEVDTPSPTVSPTASPTVAPTTCDISYKLIMRTSSSSSSSGGASWDFAYGKDRSRIAASSSGVSYKAGSTFLEEGCLPNNCYKFEIRGGVETYSLFIDGHDVAESLHGIEGTETSLFGTCEII